MVDERMSGEGKGEKKITSKRGRGNERERERRGVGEKGGGEGGENGVDITERRGDRTGEGEKEDRQYW